MKEYTLACGCVRDPTWAPVKLELCEAHLLRQEAEKLLETAVGVPLCPDCKMDSRRPKCAFELGGSCPRHPVQEAWEKARSSIQQYLTVKSTWK